MKRILAVVFCVTMAHGYASIADKKKDTVYTNVTALLKTINTTKKKKATYYLELTTADSSKVKLRINFKQLKADIPLYKSGELDFEKLLGLSDKKMAKANKKLKEFDEKVDEQLTAKSQVAILNKELTNLKAADSTTYDSTAVAQKTIELDEKGKTAKRLLDEYNQLFREYKKLVADALGNIHADYQNRLAKAIEGAYEKLLDKKTKETEFLTLDDDAWFYDISINLLKVDATRPMLVSHRVNGGGNKKENIAAGSNYFIMHFAEFGAWYEKERLIKLFNGIKLSEAGQNPYLLDKQFALVSNSKYRTQHYLNMVVDYKNYEAPAVEEKTEENFETNTMWISQFDCKQIKKIIGINCRCVAVGSSPGNNCCNQACRAILKNEGTELTGERIIIVKTDTDDNCKTKDDSINFQKGLEHLNKSLEKGFPVLVGVQKLNLNNRGEWDFICSPYSNNPKSANHYLVIVSKKGNQYRYYEVGTQHRSKGTADMNIFYHQNSILESKKINNKKYRITDIRVNKLD